MTNEKILKKAIEIAESNGYNTPLLEREVLIMPRKMGKRTSLDIWTNGLITQHDFAKAFWGDRNICRACMDLNRISDKEQYPNSVGSCDDCGENSFSNFIFEWQFHLQQMVLEENPIKYLKQFVK